MAFQLRPVFLSGFWTPLLCYWFCGKSVLFRVFFNLLNTDIKFMLYLR